jgi:integrase
MPTYDNLIRLPQASFSGKLPCKPRNLAVRSREYLTEAEVGKLMKAARNTGRHGHRDVTLILIAYRHALRVAELVALRWEQIDLGQGCCTWYAGSMGWIAHTPCAVPTRQSSLFINVIVWAILALVFGVIVMLILQLPEVVDLVRGR